MKIGIIACSSRKVKKNNIPARELYSGSDLFRKSIKAVEGLDRWYIVSAKYGLLKPDDIVSYYDLKLDKVRDKKFWGRKVIIALARECDLEKDQFYLYTGDLYNRQFEKYLKNRIKPLEGLSIGYRLQYLKKL